MAVIMDLKESLPIPQKNQGLLSRQGIDYHFVSPGEFELKIAHGFFMEWSGAYEAYYGSPRDILGQLAGGKSFMLIIDRVGAEQILKVYPAAVPIWVYTRTIDDLLERLVQP